MKMNLNLVVFILAIFSMFSFKNQPTRIEKKVTKEITSYFEIEDFKTTTMVISQENNNSVKSEFSKDNLLEIKSNDALLGYAYIGNAPSKTARFDYLVLFNPDFEILKSKVLIYREEYGGEIGSKRWLKQFIGISINDDTTLSDIDAISGATISVRSMTNSISTLLESIKKLHSANII